MIVPLIVPFGSSGHRLIRLEDCPARSTRELLLVCLCLCAPPEVSHSPLWGWSTFLVVHHCLPPGLLIKSSQPTALWPNGEKRPLLISCRECYPTRAAKFSKSEEVENVCLCFLMWIYIWLSIAVIEMPLIIWHIKSTVHILYTAAVLLLIQKIHWTTAKEPEYKGSLHGKCK